MTTQLQTPAICILMPEFNDWGNLRGMLDQLNRSLSAADYRAEILLVDDGSTVPEDLSSLLAGKWPALSSLEILTLGRNVGHQRAIAIGLAFISENKPCDAVVVMDSDGEDDPKDVPRLIQKYEQEKRGKLVFAQRAKRSESLLFRVFYVFYRALYRLLTGFTISFGNFSIIPRPLLERAVLISEIWNHYAAGILKARLPHVLLPTVRAKRISGQSKMDFTSLVINGLSSISVFSDTIGVRALLLSTTLSVMTVAGIIAVVLIKMFTTLAIPGWASSLVSALFIILFQSLVGTLIFAFMILNSRSTLAFLPKKDYHIFTLGIHKVF
jgi:polyisoprenyl-phosphate glycosyltransferase